MNSFAREGFITEVDSLGVIFEFVSGGKIRIEYERIAELCGEDIGYAFEYCVEKARARIVADVIVPETGYAKIESFEFI